MEETVNLFVNIIIIIFSFCTSLFMSTRKEKPLKQRIVACTYSTFGDRKGKNFETILHKLSIK